MEFSVKSFIFAAIFVGSLSASCTKEGCGLADSDIPIRFVASLSENTAEVKGGAPLTTASLESFGVFTAHFAEDDSIGLLDRTFMLNVPYRKNTADDRFDTSPERFWPVSGNLSFFAVAPYDRYLTELVDVDAIFKSSAPTLEWAPDSDPAMQVDVCVAVAPRQSGRSAVPLEFHHATSQIYFAANYIELEPYQFIIIDEITVSNIIGSKKVTVTQTPPYVEWEADGNLPRTRSYNLSRAGGHLSDVRVPLAADSPRGAEISTQAGHLFLVPQSYNASSSDIELKVSYTLYHEDISAHGAVETVGHYNMEAVMPRCQWKPDTRYRYLLSIHDITREKDGVSISMFQDGKAVYYPMVCSFLLPSDTKTVGTEYNLSVQVGPQEVTATNKEVDWYVDGVPMQDIYDNPGSDEVQALPILLQYRDADGNPVDPKDVYGTSTHSVWVICRKITAPGKVDIKARTRWAATDDTHKEATMELTVVGKDGGMDSYPSDDYDWTYPPTGGSFTPYGQYPGGTL